jgi:hypothetical protein
MQQAPAIESAGRPESSARDLGSEATDEQDWGRGNLFPDVPHADVALMVAWSELDSARYAETHRRGVSAPAAQRTKARLSDSD